MRRVIQRTVRTTKIISLTITHSESEEAVEYTLVDEAEPLNDPTPSQLAEVALDHPTAGHDELDRSSPETPAPSASGPDYQAKD